MEEACAVFVSVYVYVCAYANMYSAYKYATCEAREWCAVTARAASKWSAHLPTQKHAHTHALTCTHIHTKPNVPGI